MPGFLDQVARAAPKVFVLTGGDPMMRDDLPDIIAGATRRGLAVSLSPSATPRFLQADLRRFRDAGLKRVSLSLDGASAETHDAFRGVPGTWDRTMEAIIAARGAGLRELRDPDQLKGKCARCEFRTLCGGSRARAYGLTGDWLAEEPLCLYQPPLRAGRFMPAA